jgi:hypothetical protein
MKKRCVRKEKEKSTERIAYEDEKTVCQERERKIDRENGYEDEKTVCQERERKKE